MLATFVVVSAAQGGGFYLTVRTGRTSFVRFWYASRVSALEYAESAGYTVA